MSFSSARTRAAFSTMVRSCHFHAFPETRSNSPELSIAGGARPEACKDAPRDAWVLWLVGRLVAKNWGRNIRLHSPCLLDGSPEDTRIMLHAAGAKRAHGVRAPFRVRLKSHSCSCSRWKRRYPAPI